MLVNDIEVKVAVAKLKDYIGEQYYIYMSSLSGGEDFRINSGTIESVYVEEGTLFVDLKNQPIRTEHFTLERIKTIGIAEREGFDSVKIVFMDGSYFKIFLERENTNNKKGAV